MLLTFPAGKFQGYRDREDVWCRCTVRRLGSRRTNGGHCVQLLFFRSKRRLFIILPSNVFHACLKHRPHDRLVPWCFWTGYINHSGIYDLCTTVVLAEGTYCRHSRFTHNAQKIAWTKNNLFFSSCETCEICKFAIASSISSRVVLYPCKTEIDFGDWNGQVLRLEPHQCITRALHGLLYILMSS